MQKKINSPEYQTGKVSPIDNYIHNIFQDFSLASATRIGELKTILYLYMKIGYPIRREIFFQIRLLERIALFQKKTPKKEKISNAFPKNYETGL